MGSLLAVLVISAIIFGAACYVGIKRGEKLQAEGLIIKRDIDFVKETQYFKLKSISYEDFKTEIMKIDFARAGVRATAYDDQKGIFFASKWGWEAQIRENKSNDDNSSVYAFKFLKWDTRRNIPINVESMNILLTAIEKTILKIDPNTSVSKSLAEVTSTPWIG